MTNRYIHTCIRVRDPEASERFYEALGFERRGRLNFETAYNVYMGLPGDGDVGPALEQPEAAHAGTPQGVARVRRPP